MVIKYTYLLSFPFKARFNKDPKYLIYAGIFRRIKKLTCININNKCENCSLHNSCIYYYLSGENFLRYPGIIIDRFTIEKKTFQQHEFCEIKLYLFHDLVKFEDFIKSFFEDNNYLYNNFFQINDFKKTILKTNKLYSGEIFFYTPILDYDQVNQQLSYYNEKYNLNINNSIRIEVIASNKVSSNERLYINNALIRFEGYIGKFQVENYDMSLFEVGIGKINFLGGGRAYEVENFSQVRKQNNKLEL